MNLNRIEAYHNPGNEASGRVMEKIGFKKEGIWRQRDLKNNMLLDKICFSLLREEYTQP
jgi:ribosomal-protein-alanine N-acetyltransferase